MTLLDIAVGGIISLASVFVGAILSQYGLIRPKICIQFEGNPICSRGNTIRLKVSNKGSITAKNCEAKLRIYDSQDKLVQDGHILHWARLIPFGNMPGIIDNSYKQLNIASHDGEYIDLFLVANIPTHTTPGYWGIYSYPFVTAYVGFNSFNISQIIANQTSKDVFKGEVIICADSLKPSKLEFYFTVDQQVISIGVDRNSIKVVKTC